MNKGGKSKKQREELINLLNQWNDVANTFQISVQKKQFHEAALNIKQLAIFINQYLTELKGFSGLDTIEDIQRSMLSRIILILRDIKVNSTYIPESNDSILKFEQSILELNSILYSKSGNCPTFHSVIAQILAFSTIKKEEVSSSLEKLLESLAKSLDSKSFEIFLHESSATGIDLVSSSIFLLIRSAQSNPAKFVSKNSFIYEYLITIGKAIPQIIQMQKLKFKADNQDLLTKQVSIICKGIFDVMNVIVQNVKQKESPETNLYTQSFEVLVGLIGILENLIQFFDSKTLHLLTALLQKCGAILSSYFQSNFFTTPNNHRFLNKALDHFYKLLPIIYKKIIPDDKSKITGNQINIELGESVVSLNVLLAQKCLGFTMQNEDLLKEDVQFSNILLVLKSFYQGLLLFVGLYADQIASNPSLIYDDITSNSGKSQNKSNPVAEKFYKLMSYLVLLIVESYDSSSAETRQFVDETIIEIRSGNDLLSNFLLSLMLREKKSKVYAYMKENKSCSMDNYIETLKLLMAPSLSNDNHPNCLGIYESVHEAENSIMLINLRSHISSKQTDNESDAFQPQDLLVELKELKMKIGSLTPTLSGTKVSKTKKPETQMNTAVFLLHKMKADISYYLNKYYFEMNEEKSAENTFSEAEKTEIFEISSSFKQMVEIFGEVFNSRKSLFDDESEILENNSEEKLLTNLFIIFFNSEELLSYFALIHLLGNYSLLHQVYSIFVKNSSMFSFYSRSSLYYSATELTNLLRIILCIHYYWNFLPEDCLKGEKQLFNTPSNRNLLENLKRQNSSSSIISSLSSTSTSTNNSSLTSPVAILSKYSPSENNLFLTLEDYFYSCHQLVLKLQYDENENEEFVEEDEIFAKRVELQKQCNYLISELTENLNSNSNSSINLLKHRLHRMGIASWIYAFFARILFYQFGDIYESFAYCRLALTHCSTAKKSSQEDRLHLEWISTKFEIVLLLAEIYEFMGKTQKTIDYLAESLSLTMNFTSLQSLYSLQAFRVFYRMNSSRIYDIIHPFLHNPTNEVPSPRSRKSPFLGGNTPVHDQVVRNAFLFILKLFPEVLMNLGKKHMEITQETNNSEGTTTTNVIDLIQPTLVKFSGEIKYFQFRFNFRYWGFSNDYANEVQKIFNQIKLKSPISSSKILVESSSLSELIRNQNEFSFCLNVGSKSYNHYLNELFHGNLLVSSSSSSSSSCSEKSQENDISRMESLPELLENFSKLHNFSKYNFQILKQLRKELSFYYYQHISTENEATTEKLSSKEDILESPKFQGFLLGISTFYVSNEFSNLPLSSFSHKSDEISNVDTHQSGKKIGTKDILLHQSREEQIFSSYGNLIHQSITYNDANAKEILLEKFEKLISPHESSSAPASMKDQGMEYKLAYISLDHIHKQIHLGGINNHYPDDHHAHSFPSNLSFQVQILDEEFYSTFMNLVTEWNKILQENNQSLQIFKYENIDKITKQDKENWWKMREKINFQMENLVKGFNSLLSTELEKLFGFNSTVDLSIEIVPEVMKETNVSSKNEREIIVIDEEEEEDQENRPSTANLQQSTASKVATKPTSKKGLSKKDSSADREKDEIQSLGEAFSMKLTIDTSSSVNMEKTSQQSKPTTPVRTPTKNGISSQLNNLQAIYNEMKLPELKAKCKEKGLVQAGKKAELIQRLIDHEKTTSASKKRMSFSSSKPSTVSNTHNPRMSTNISTNSIKKSLSKTSSGSSIDSSWSSANLLSDSVIRPSTTKKPSLQDIPTIFDEISTETPVVEGQKKSPAAPSEETKEKSQSNCSEKNAKGADFKKIHLYLMVDELLQNIPFESMDCLKSLSCSRLLSLSHLCHLVDHVLAPAAEKKISSVKKTSAQLLLSSAATAAAGGGANAELPALDCNKCWYAIDVENNLPATRETMTDFISKYQSMHSWQGVVGKLPDTEELIQFHSMNDLFVYCGHGSGERLYSKLSSSSSSSHTKKENNSSLFPATFLWGCSSVRIHDRGYHESNGALLTLVEKGSPFVVGNLWDVTDRDLDRLSMDCMENYFQFSSPPMTNTQSTKAKHSSSNSQSATMSTKKNNLSQVLTNSRQVCKLPYAVGASPVLYGLPLPCK